jgi:hypothetical protein
MTDSDADRQKRIGGAIDAIFYAVRQFGSALDADDHYPGAGAPLEAEGNASIRHAFARTPELGQILPGLHERVLRGENLADRGFEITDEILLRTGRRLKL